MHVRARDRSVKKLVKGSMCHHQCRVVLKRLKGFKTLDIDSDRILEVKAWIFCITFLC